VDKAKYKVEVVLPNGTVFKTEGNSVTVVAKDGSGGCVVGDNAMPAAYVNKDMAIAFTVSHAGR
jgi:hypothetical protein